MAILDDLPGVRIQITLDGTPIKEYDHDDASEERTVTKYVEATSNQVFAVFIELLPSFKFNGDCIGFTVEADGMVTDRPIITRDSRKRSRLVEGCRLSDTWVEKFQFNSLHIGDNSSSNREDASRVKQLGSVAIQCTHKSILHLRDPNPPERLESPGIVSEKALKGQAISHNIAFTGPKKCAGSTWYKTEPTPGFPTPVATFVSRYRSLAALKSMLIIPRTPSPEPSPEPLERREAASLSTADIEELQRRLQATQGDGDNKEKVKRELNDGTERPRKRARPSTGVTVLEIDDDGTVQESSVTPDATGDRDVIVLD